jgi:hypothetical protein
VAEKLIWFTPGLFVDARGEPLAKQRGVADKNDFNVVTEGHPSTGGDGRPSYVPTYGQIESILPDQRLLAHTFSPVRSEVEWFKANQTFLMGKKRTMFQIIDLSKVVEGVWKFGGCTTGWLELPPAYGGRFRSFEVLAATMRYLILRGATKEDVRYVEFRFASPLRLPDFYLDGTPLGNWNSL